MKQNSLSLLLVNYSRISSIFTLVTVTSFCQYHSDDVFLLLLLLLYVEHDHERSLYDRAILIYRIYLCIFFRNIFFIFILAHAHSSGS